MLVENKDNLSIDEIHELLEINDDLLDFYRYKGWLYKLFHWAKFKEIEKENKYLNGLLDVNLNRFNDL